MYIEQAYKGRYEWWRYIVGVIIAIAGIFIFSVPHVLAIAIKQFRGEVDVTRLEDMNYVLTLFESNVNLVLILLPFVGGLICLLLAVKFLHKQTLTQITTSREKIDWKRIWFVFFFWGIISSGLVILDYYVTPDHYLVNFKLIPFIILSIIAILLVPLQTSFEEYMFRGYLMQGLGVLTKKRWVPLIVTSLVFGSLHIANTEVEKLGYVIMIYYIGTGLFLGIMTLMDEGLELAIGFHAANNLFTALLVTADWTAFQTHSILKDISEPNEAGFTDIFMPVFVLFPILLMIFAKKYKWTNWKEKLFGRVEDPPSPIEELVEEPIDIVE